jgi:hypothetical protein
MDRRVLSCADSMPSSSMANPACSIFRRTSGRLAISSRAFTKYLLRMPWARIKSQTRSTRSMSNVNRSSVKPTILAGICANSATTDSGDRADQLRFVPQGLRLNEQNLQLNGQPRDEAIASTFSPVSAPATMMLYV